MWKFTFDREKEQHPSGMVFPGLDSIEFIKGKEGQFRPFHSHEECRLLFCTGGSGFLRLNDREQELSPGILVTIRPGVLHSIGTREGELEFWVLSFRSSGPEDELTRFFLQCEAPAAGFSAHPDYVKGAFLLLLDLCGENGTDHSRTGDIRAQVFALLSFARMMFEEHPIEISDSRDVPMQKVMRWIIDHYKEDISPDRLAREFATSTSNLSRSFYQTFQISPINYLIDYRLSVAKDLLLNSDKNIEEISLEVGFEDLEHFSGLFEKRIGRTPRQFRKSARREDPRLNRAQPEPSSEQEAPKENREPEDAGKRNEAGVPETAGEGKETGEPEEVTESGAPEESEEADALREPEEAKEADAPEEESPENPEAELPVPETD